MREIKFRAWDYDTNIMVYPDSELETIFCFDKVGLSIYQANGRELSSFEVMQYTGFRDKNGKEIYEGDIIEFRHNNGHMTKDYIMFEDGRFTTGLGYNLHYFVMRRDGVKVIGNIYQDKGYKAYIDYPNGL